MIIPCLSCILQLSVHDELFLSAFKNNLALCHKCNHDQKINHNENYSLWDYVSLCSPLWLFLITSFLHCQNSQKSGLYILSPISQFFFSPPCKPTIGITTIFYAMRVIKCTNDHHAAINDRTSYKHFFKVWISSLYWWSVCSDYMESYSPMPSGSMKKHQDCLVMGWYLPRKGVSYPATSLCALYPSLPQTRHVSLCFSLHDSKIESIIMSSM